MFSSFFRSNLQRRDMNATTNQKKAYVYALVTVACWSTSASAFKLSLHHAGVLTLLLIASTTSTAVFGISLAATRKFGLIKTLAVKDYLWSAGLGFLNPFLYYALVLKAYSLLPAQEAQPINFLWPLALVLLSIPLLGQRVRLVSILALCISFAGVVVIATHPSGPTDLLHLHFSNPAGVLLALGSTFVWALYWILNTRDKRDEALRLFLNFVFGSMFVAALLLFHGPVQAPPLKGMAGGIYIGLFEMGLAFLTWLKALRTAETTACVASLIYLVPFLALIVVHFVVGETILPSTVVGLVLIVGGIMIQKSWGEGGRSSSGTDHR
jgi:drug/metabolite transporter (DMT)-like permease